MSKKPTRILLSEAKEFAFTQHYIDHFDAMISIAKKMLRSNEQAEDVVQDVFLHFADRLRSGELENVRDFRSYLYRSVMNKASDRLLQRDKEYKATREYVLTIDRSQDPDITVADKDLVERLLLKLPPGRREALRLVKVEGMSEKAAADFLSISKQTIHTHVKVALKYLRKHSSTLYLITLILFNR